MLEFLRSTVEWKQLGFNMLTFSAIITVVLTLFQAWSLNKQARVIWGNKKGDSVSVTMFSYMLFYLISFFIYGFFIKSIAAMANGLLAAFVIPIFLGLCKFKKFTSLERCCIPVFCVLPVAMLASPHKQSLFLFMLGGLLVAFACPARELLRSKDSGFVEVRVIVTTMVVNAFWFAYACALGDIPLMIFNPLSFVLMGFTLLLWMKYKRISVCGA